MPAQNIETFSKFQSPVGPMQLVFEDEKLKGLYFVEAAVEKNLAYNQAIQEETQQQLSAYFSKKRKDFDLPLLLEGTSFQKEVWDALCKVPYNQPLSYKDFARQLGKEKSVRAVANANGKNKIPIIVPCHRIIASGGGLGGYSAGLWRKEWLIAHESDTAEAFATAE